jgi:hypothetical protein
MQLGNILNEHFFLTESCIGYLSFLLICFLNPETGFSDKDIMKNKGIPLLIPDRGGME